LSDLYRQKKLVLSFELFPPKTDAGMENLKSNLPELVHCKPSFMTCTYGAGGSTRDRTLEILAFVKENQPNLPLATHLTCVGSTVEELRAYIDKAVQQGVSYIVALRGDPPRGETNFKPVPNGLRYGNELVALIRSEYPGLGVIVAGYPETHPEAVSPEIDLENLKRKVDAGGDVIVTQLFYHNDVFYRFLDRCEKAGIDVPIVPGLLPITRLSQIKPDRTMFGARLPDSLVDRMEAFADNEAEQFFVGAYSATRQVEELIDQGVPGIHFYVLNKSQAAAHICRALALHRITAHMDGV
jgi:methylenetetrahydrofolate reductase (NADPH)